MLIREINDPRLKLISITDVKVDKELAYADVYVSAVEGHTRSAEILAGLEFASGFLRRTLAERIEFQSFSTPPLPLGPDARECRSHREGAG